MSELDKAKEFSWFVELPIGEPKWGHMEESTGIY